MYKKSKKQLREEAINAEITRREVQRADKSPLNREQLLSLVEYVGKSIIENNHERDFKYTRQWAAENNTDIDVLLTFLQGERLKEDWDVAVSCDPFELFGGSENRLAWMPLEESEFGELLEWLDEQLEEKGCHHDFALTRTWLASKAVDTSTTLMALMAKGGGCDCEIVYNVEPENIYP